MMTDKKLLRKQMKKMRQELHSGDEEIVKNFFSLPFAADKPTFFVYNPFGAEADTMPVIKRLLTEGKI